LRREKEHAGERFNPSVTAKPKQLGHQGKQDINENTEGNASLDLLRAEKGYR